MPLQAIATGGRGPALLLSGSAPKWISGRLKLVFLSAIDGDDGCTVSEGSDHPWGSLSSGTAEMGTHFCVPSCQTMSVGLSSPASNMLRRDSSGTGPMRFLFCA